MPKGSNPSSTPRNTGLYAGSNNTASALSISTSEPIREVKVGDVLTLQVYPYGGIQEVLPQSSIHEGMEIVEVTVTAVKKAKISFE